MLGELGATHRPIFSSWMTWATSESASTAERIGFLQPLNYKAVKDADTNPTLFKRNDK